MVVSELYKSILNVGCIVGKYWLLFGNMYSWNIYLVVVRVWGFKEKYEFVFENIFVVNLWVFDFKIFIFEIYVKFNFIVILL